MIQQVCTIYCKNWGWPCHINNVSPVGQKTAWRICKYLAFVVAVLLSWPAFTSSQSQSGSTHPLRSHNNNNTPMASKQSQFLITRDRITLELSESVVSPPVLRYLLCLISPEFTTSREEEGAKSVSGCCCVRIDFHLIPLWAASGATQPCSVRHSALVNWKLRH